MSTDGMRSLLVNRAFRSGDLEEENRKVPRSSQVPVLDGLLARSDTMTRVCRVIEKIAPTAATALQLGERIHNPFIGISCTAVPETLLESESFGHERGAFTGALFLDEIGDMAPSLQAKLLRFPRDRRVERTGSRQSVAVNARIVVRRTGTWMRRSRPDSFARTCDASGAGRNH